MTSAPYNLDGVYPLDCADLQCISIDSKRVPPNVQFEVDDVEVEWPERPPFDLIHSRYMCGSISDWPKLFERAYK